jgi:hypothetical protein
MRTIALTRHHIITTLVSVFGAFSLAQNLGWLQSKELIRSLGFSIDLILPAALWPLLEGKLATTTQPQFPREITIWSRQLVSILAGSHWGNLRVISCSRHLTWVCLSANFMHIFKSLKYLLSSTISSEPGKCCLRRSWKLCRKSIMSSYFKWWWQWKAKIIDGTAPAN